MYTFIGFHWRMNCFSTFDSDFCSILTYPNFETYETSSIPTHCKYLAIVIEYRTHFFRELYRCLAMSSVYQNWNWQRRCSHEKKCHPHIIKYLLNWCQTGETSCRLIWGGYKIKFRCARNMIFFLLFVSENFKVNPIIWKKKLSEVIYISRLIFMIQNDIDNMTLFIVALLHNPFQYFPSRASFVLLMT